MMKSKNLYFLLIVIVIGILLLIAGNPQVIRPSKLGIATAKTGTMHETHEGELTATVANDPADSARVTVAFSQWFENEARDMEESSIDPHLKDAELKAAAEKLSPSEMQFLKEKAVNMKGSANDRILAVYVMSLAPGVTGDALLEIAQAPLVNQGEHPVHSPEETLAAQEKSLRRMAIDALIEQARQDESRRDSLQAAIGQIADPSLREYAEKAYQKLK